MKISEYLKGSSARLCAWWGLNITGIAAWASIGCNIAINFDFSWPVVGAICAPGIIGIIPLCFQYMKKVVDSGHVETIAAALKNNPSGVVQQ